MEMVVQSDRFTAREIRFFNYCQHFLEVYTLSDISDATGRFVEPSFLARNPSQSDSSRSFGAEASIQRQIKTEKAQRQIRVLYHLCHYCRLAIQRQWFHASPERYFLREPHLNQLEEWIAIYGPVIRETARQQRNLDQQGLQCVDVALEQSFSQDM